MIFLLDSETYSTVWYFLFFILLIRQSLIYMLLLSLFEEIIYREECTLFHFETNFTTIYRAYDIRLIYKVVKAVVKTRVKY